MTYPLGHSADQAAYERPGWTCSRTGLRFGASSCGSPVRSPTPRFASSRFTIGSRPATASRELAEEQLQAEESTFEVGLSTNFFVLQSQRDLATAQDAEQRAILDYQRARIEFERTQRASLGSAGIALVGGATASGVAGPARAAPSGPFLTPQR